MADNLTDTPPTVDALRTYVGTSPDDDAYLAECLATATALVMQLVGAVDVPGEVVGRAILETGSELFHRRQAPSGIQQFAMPDGGAPAPRLARDPLTPVYPILRPYLGQAFA